MAQKTSVDRRTRPNILITGVPCSGKTTIAQQLAAQSGLEYMDINDAIVKYKLHSGFDEKYNSFVLDEDKLLDYLEVILF
jgi:broad-specificity NMP kinase